MLYEGQYIDCLEYFKCKDLNGFNIFYNKHKTYFNVNHFIKHFGLTFLHIATELNDYKMCERLLTIGADCSIINMFGKSPLQIAIRNNNDDLIELFFRFGKELNELKITNKRLYENVEDLQTENSCHVNENKKLCDTVYSQKRYINNIEDKNKKLKDTVNKLIKK
jgi:ankyrin repeat protein